MPHTIIQDQNCDNRLGQRQYKSGKVSKVITAVYGNCLIHLIRNTVGNGGSGNNDVSHTHTGSHNHGKGLVNQSQTVHQQKGGNQAAGKVHSKQQNLH